MNPMVRGMSQSYRGDRNDGFMLTVLQCADGGRPQFRPKNPGLVGPRK